ncbi:hypothetical protein NQ317_007836 [Molorchus minor]|uniref:KIF-binding protein n=1 Tax=Molorchus minor TaxID=1323400 RepID=A0ABQ9K317_9CUCU|nr:hypothetical protein NQ317_007836 [Molorchus minor]
MTITKESFVDLQEKYNKVKKLLEEDSKLDPPNEPHLSKYSARQILIGMKASIENLMRSQSSEGPDTLKLTGAVYLYLGMVSLDTEEPSTGEKYLEKCKEIIEKYADIPEFILITLNMYNQFGILWYHREPEKSQVYLDKAEELYLHYKEKSAPPIDISDLFQTNIETFNSDIALKNMEKIYTLTLYYLAQRQLQMNDYDPIDWALNAATLSQFFMENNGFKQARHHLAASSYMLQKHEKELNEITEQDEVYEAKMETFKHRSADVARCWSKYGLILLARSKERLLNHTDDIDTNCPLSTDLSKLELAADSTISQEDLKNLDFKGIDVTLFESQITDQFVLTLNDARKVFLNSQQWTIKAQEYYTLDDLASDYIEIVLDQSQLYLNLLFFEDCPENQAKLHKRRVNLLEGILDKVNSQYYLQYCRQVWFELGRTYGDILDIKAEKLRESKGRPAPQTLTKINSLSEKSIHHYLNFINSLKNKITGELPAKIQDDEKAYLQALFHIAALYGRYITLDKELQIKKTESSLEYHRLFKEYCDKNTKAKELVPMEYEICKEMVDLLPIKILKLKRS